MSPFEIRYPLGTGDEKKRAGSAAPEERARCGTASRQRARTV